ncbi:MAG: DUF839 domain-containing protein, partial [Planctomycetes bacterium]|nr:DUF839 domain-containing protein [Planctomycetota bacterium]
TDLCVSERMHRPMPAPAGATTFVPLLVCSTLLLPPAVAQADPPAFPLPTFTGNTTPFESTAPFALPLRSTQTRIVNRQALIASQALHPGLGNWDMIAVDDQSRFVFVPCERTPAAGLFRYDMQTGAVEVVLHGSGAPRVADPAAFDPTTAEYERLDPATLTPWGTLITAEEVTGGRLFEILDPFAPTGPFQVVWRSAIPSSKHEGLRFDSTGALYFVDESSSGSIYRFVPTTPGDLSQGQTFVLRVDAYATSPTAAPNQSWSATGNQQAPRTGPATWVPMTDPTGTPLTVADPFVYVTATGARDAADELGATPYGRPEDLEVGTLANGNEAVYVALTSEDSLIAIELLPSGQAHVHPFVTPATIDLSTGQPIGAELTAPDNVTKDAWGNVWFCEDHLPGDIFRVHDVDGDGVAEELARVSSLGVAGSEPSGILFDPRDPYRMFATILNPASNDDAIWTFDLRPYPGHQHELLTLRAAVAATPSSHLPTGPGSQALDAAGGEFVTLAVESPSGQLSGAPFVLALQPILTASGPPLLPASLWVDPFGGTILPLSGNLGTLPGAAPFGGNSIDLPVPAGLAGVSAMAQPFALEAGVLVFGDAVEVVLR